MLFDDAGEETPAADAVRPHDHRFVLPRLVEEFAAERVAIARAELKNVSDFDAA